MAESYDYAYGLVRDKAGAFVFSYAPYANTHLPGSGGAIRLLPGKEPVEIAQGFRNPLGWCNGPDGEIFFTDNQGEWVATNKLCRLVEGRHYGFPNPGRPRLAASARGEGRENSGRPYGFLTTGPGRSTASRMTAPATSSAPLPANSSWPS
jgi:hypothetical protein